MATIQLGNTKSINSLISYCEKKADEIEGLNCSKETAKEQMRATREMYNKNDKIQGHHVIQSFRPGEVTPEKANQIGKELAEKLAKGHEVMIYTHADKNHIHNHIVINSVNYENGKKFHLHGKEGIEKVRNLSDDLCKKHDLSIVNEKADKRYAIAEYGLAERGVMSWKDEIREVVDLEKNRVNSFDEFKNTLKEKYNIDIAERGKNITFTHPNGRKVRGKTLGLNYERGTIKNGFDRQIERGTDTSREQREFREVDDRNSRTQQVNAELHQGTYEGEYSNSSNDRCRTRENKKDKSRDTEQYDFDIKRAREHSERLHKQTSSAYGDWKERNDRKQSKDSRENGQNREVTRNQHEQNKSEHGKETRRSRGKDLEIGG